MMLRTMLKSKIHGAKVTETNLHYCGSITIDPALMEEANILPNEQVHVFNITSGARFVTYAIKGREKGDGEICINGAAARLAEPGDQVIIISFVDLPDAEARGFEPKILNVDRFNSILV